MRGNNGNRDRIAYLRFKLSMLDRWIHQLDVERRYTDNEFQKLTLKERDNPRFHSNDNPRSEHGNLEIPSR